MLEDDFQFHFGQVRSIHHRMENTPAFRPDGLSPSQVQAILDAAELIGKDFREKKTDLDWAESQFEADVEAGHDACVQVYPIMKSRYRRDAASLERILNLPTQDQSAQETEARLAAMVALWTTLPLPPGATTPFVAWEGMGLAELTARLSSLRAQKAALEPLDQALQTAEAALRLQTEALADFATAALMQGRAQFAGGGSELELINKIPTLGTSPAPLRAAILEALTPEPGAVQLRLEAKHATWFEMWCKGPKDREFLKWPEPAKGMEFNAKALAPGVYHFKAVGRNSRGAGRESAVVSLTVG